MEFRGHNTYLRLRLWPAGGETGTLGRLFPPLRRREHAARSPRRFQRRRTFPRRVLGLKAIYTFNKHLKGLVWTEFFFPGDYYTDFRNDVVTFLRGELYFTW